MDSASIPFVVFGLLAAVLSNLSRAVAWRNAVLLAASGLFIALLVPPGVNLLPFGGFLLLGYCAILLLQRGVRQILALSVVAVVLAYVWLKKYTFLPDGLLLTHPYFTLGLSYVFFRVLHLIIQAGDEESPRIGPYGYLLYTLNFTTFVSGPIQRYEDFARDQFAPEPLGLGARVVGLQIERMIRGFFKVNVLATFLHALQDDALVQLFEPVPLPVKLLAAARLAAVYPLFLYCNFSGYIDLVIALARLMRLQLPENFNRPFSASCALNFWSQWHMTLSSWLRTYVYNPLLLVLMRRVSSSTLQPLLGVLCFFVTFFLIGIWHGRTSEFVMFGFVQGGGVAVNKLWQLAMARALGRKGYQALCRNGGYVAVGRGLNYAWFAFTLFWFWADWTLIGKVFAALPPGQWLGVWLAVWVVATGVLAAWEALRALLLSVRTSEGPVFTSRYARVVFASALGLLGFVMVAVLNQPAPGIVYKAF